MDPIRPMSSPTPGGNSGRTTPSSDSSPGKLFVGGLSWQTTPEKLKEYFGQFGLVTDVLVMKDPVTQVRTRSVWNTRKSFEHGHQGQILPYNVYFGGGFLFT